ncbi:MAG TPA: cytochrome B [Balneola sp.]|nr:cytochrome B [Bacteroidota bacterium]MAC04397.1 cytochrome B [Balneola sp.]MAO78413.1 cytochrome B [Balneola sp.]MBF64413.1 cytochrome B [Balneola sp.]HAH50903.1 cytochrome B [Balneola sp.]|tara:strand:+ start:27572 stop:28012 length:441 start_codon:yes stop_codon:yes gene_type:complete
MYNILVHLHSVNRWIVLLLIVLALIKSFSGWFGKKDFTDADKKSALFALIFTHIQLILGLALFFISPLVSFEEGALKSEIFRFYTVEHFTMMIIAIALITIGFSLSKRAQESITKFKRVAVFYLLGLIIILSSIPWPFRIPGAGWF